MLYIDVEGGSVKMAIQKGLKQLDLEESEVKTEVLSQGKKGFFGIGSKELAKVRIFYKEGDEVSSIFESIKKIVAYIDDNAVCSFDKVEERNYLRIDSQIPEQFIGKAGKTQNALQTLINALLQKKNNLKIIVDINNYSEKKKNNFSRWINEQIKTILKDGKPIILKPMNSFQRRIVHLEVKKYPNLKSESRGMTKLKSIKISRIDESAGASNTSGAVAEEDAQKDIYEEQKKFAEQENRQEDK